MLQQQGVDRCRGGKVNGQQDKDKKKNFPHNYDQ